MLDWLSPVATTYSGPYLQSFIPPAKNQNGPLSIMGGVGRGWIFQGVQGGGGFVGSEFFSNSIMSKRDSGFRGGGAKGVITYIVKNIFTINILADRTYTKEIFRNGGCGS